MPNEIREIVLDTETTGLYHSNGDRIIEIGCVEIINKVRTGEYYHVYLNPETEISQESYNIHGISNDFIKDKPIFRKVCDEFLKFIGNSSLVIHNAGFDMGFINFELGLCGYQPIPNGRVIDTLKMARKKHPGSPASLDALCKRYSISLETRDKHGALIDAELLAQVYIELQGGSQGAMSFSNEASQVEIEIKRQIREKREFKISQNAVNQHADFIENNVPNSVWHKYSNFNKSGT